MREGRQKGKQARKRGLSMSICSELRLPSSAQYLVEKRRYFRSSCRTAKVAKP